MLPVQAHDFQTRTVSKFPRNTPRTTCTAVNRPGDRRVGIHLATRRRKNHWTRKKNKWNNIVKIIGWLFDKMFCSLCETTDYYSCIRSHFFQDHHWTRVKCIKYKHTDKTLTRSASKFSFFRLLDPEDTFRYDQFKRNYAEILYRWDMHVQRTEVMKFCTERLDGKKGIGKDFIIFIYICMILGPMHVFSYSNLMLNLGVKAD